MKTVEPVPVSPMLRGDAHARRGAPELRTEPLVIEAVETRVPSLLQRYRALRPAIVIAVLLAGVGGFLYGWLSPCMYTSTITLYVDPADVKTTEDSPLTGVSDDIMRVHYAATSTEMADHLINTFDLYAHYGIPRGGPMQRSLALMRTLEAVRAHYLDRRSLKVSVRDTDRELAVAMANAVFAKLKAMAEREASETLQRSIAVYEGAVGRAEDRGNERMQQLARMMADHASAHPSEDIAENTALLRSIDAFNSADQRADRLRQMADLASEVIASAEHSPISMMREAMPDMLHSPRRNAIGFGSAAAALMLVLMLLGIAIWHKHGHEVRTYFTT